MKLNEKINSMKGRLHLTAFDKQENELWQTDESNLIVNSGFNIITQVLGGQSDAYIKYIALGTNGVPPTTLDNTIQDAQLIEISGVDYPASTIVRFNFTIGYGDYAGMTVCEFGLMGANGQLFSRKTREPIEKTDEMSITGFWDIIISENPALCQVVIIPTEGVVSVSGAGMVVLGSSVELNCNLKEDYNFIEWKDLNTGETCSEEQTTVLTADRSYLLSAETQSALESPLTVELEGEESEDNLSFEIQAKIIE